MTVEEAREELELLIASLAAATASYSSGSTSLATVGQIREGITAAIDAFESAVREDLARRFDKMAKQAHHNVMMDNSHGPKAATWKQAASMARGESK